MPFSSQQSKEAVQQVLYHLQESDTPTTVTEVAPNQYQVVTEAHTTRPMDETGLHHFLAGMLHVVTVHLARRATKYDELKKKAERILTQ